MLNLVMTVFHVIFFGFVIIAGFCHGDGVKALVEPRGLTPYGVRGVVNGAAVVYFSYIGYDTVSTLAEEIQNPSFSLPVGIIGSVSVVSVIYCLMSLVLCLMVPYNEISKSASYAIAFRRIGWGWAGNVVGAGASLGIVASLLVAMLGQARYLCVIGRARLVPSWFARVHPSTGTPLNATLFLGLCTASIALFTDLEIVMELISLGTLCVFYLVANALIYRKYTLTGHNSPLHTLFFLALLSSSAIAFSLWWKLNKPWWGLMLFLAITIAVTVFFQFHTSLISSTVNKNLLAPIPSKWSVPFMPWPAAISVFLNVFLTTTLKTLSFQRFAIWTCLVTMFYVLYGVHRTYEAEEMGRDREVVESHVTSMRVQPQKLDNVQMIVP